MSQQFPSFRFEPPTPFVKNILIGATLLYIAEQILFGWMTIFQDGKHLKLVAWNPDSIFTEPWTRLTHFFLFPNSPIGFLFEMVAIYFFLPVIVDSYGRKGLNRLLLWILIITTLLGTLGLLSGAIPSRSSSAMGLHPILIALVAIFGLKNPFATIYVLVFPIQASWVAWGSGILALLNFFAGRTLESLLVIGGWITGYLFVTGHGHIKPKKLWRKYSSKAKHDKRHRRLQAVDGGRTDKYEH